MASEFLGIGWNFPVIVDESGQIVRARHEESVRQGVWLVLGTAKGERMMRPDFGCGIHDLVFAVPNAATLGRVEKEVREALVRWEPRMELLDVEVAPEPSEPRTLVVRIEYRVRVANNVFNLVYPFYLERSAT